MIITQATREQAREIALDAAALYDAEIIVIGCWVYAKFKEVPSEAVRENLKRNKWNWNSKREMWVYPHLYQMKGRGKPLAVLAAQYGLEKI